MYRTIANSYWVFSACFKGCALICIVTSDSHNSLMIQEELLIPVYR